MEQSHLETLNHSDSLFPFPPHRRRHLKSETFLTLVRILSHCHADSHTSHSHPQGPPKQDSVENELGQATQGEVCGEPVGPISMESEILSIQRGALNSTLLGSDECFNEDRMETDEFDHVSRVNKELVPENSIKLVNNTLDKNPSGNVVSLIDNQEGQSSPQEICMEESGNVDKENYSCKVPEALDLSLDVDIYAESSRLDENNEQGSSFVERNVLEEVNEMQLMELEKWVSDCGGLNSLLRVTDDEEIEEGEISGDFGVYDQSMDLLFEDAVSLEKKNVDEEQNSEATINDEQLTCKKQKVANQEDTTKSNKNFVETIDNVGKEVELKFRESSMPEMECKSEIAAFGKNGEAKLAHGFDSIIETVRNEKQTARAIEEFNHPAVPGKISRENVTENQCTLSTEKDAGVRKKKKRGPSTKENKAKKKGDKCKFSHDTIPLTKSKMPLTEGSPSTTNVSKPELKFSSLLKSTNSEKQLNLNNSSHQKVDSSKNTKQDVVETILKRAVQTQPKGISKLMFGKSALDNPSVGGVKVGLPMIRGTPDMAQNSNEITKMTAAVESKGINFLSFGKAPLKDCGIPKSITFDDSNKDKQAASSPKKDVGLKIGNQTAQIARDVIPIWSEMPKRTPTMPPQGINFLSFGKAALDHPKDNDVVSVQEKETAPRLQIPSSKPWKQLSSLPSDQSVDQLTDEHGKDTQSSALKALLSNTPNAAQKARLSNMTNSAQKALMSTLAFAAKYESRIKMDRPPDGSANFNKESSSSQTTRQDSVKFLLLD
ncbi:hypothetical protein HYC85_025884 [Camellia sinensis]|uniref:Uncharacterized protein n=1 Tax=Camellia sinensis TaxID=4442 RepID=A0A7J7G350_CAMSI|nr:hypothetical protein HYC85_025884 [Camellia sinensis]